MPADFLHRHAEFRNLIAIVAAERAIDPALIEKDYWIMQCLYGLQQLGYSFQLKGGTSLSKGFQIIDRFSEDIDIRIEPPPGQGVAIGANQNSAAHRQSRKSFYDWLAATIRIDGVSEVLRDTQFDDLPNYRGAGIRLIYDEVGQPVDGLKSGVLLEVGFDDVAPNTPLEISSWAYDYAVGKVAIIDNRARGVACYHPGHTLVEKLQAISTKFRLQSAKAPMPANFMRHYYDVYSLLAHRDVKDFIGTDAYFAHKRRRFRRDDNPDITANDAFLLTDPAMRARFERAYDATAALYYKGRPDLDVILTEIERWAPRL
jgi:hypothetical protein